MKIKFLGTGACEGIPSMYCKCFVCENARKHKGKDFRTRTGFILDDELVIDFSPDSYVNMVKNDIVFGDIENMLISHTHEDHFYPEDLCLRVVNEPVNGLKSVLNIYGNNALEKRFRDVKFFTERKLQFTHFHVLDKGKKTQVGKYTVVAFYTQHMPNEECYVYLISREGKNYLHLVDSAYPLEEVFKHIETNDIKIDAVTADCTFGSLTTEYGGHMNVWQNIKLKQRLFDMGAINDNTKYFITHFSHFSGVDTYEHLNEIASKYGITVSYDGLEAEF